MNAPRILAFALAFAAFAATMTAAHAVFRSDVASDRPIQLKLIPTGAEDRASKWQSMDCGTFGAAGPVSFVRGPGRLGRSADAHADELGVDQSVMPGTRPLLRTIPRSTFF